MGPPTGPSNSGNFGLSNGGARELHLLTFPSLSVLHHFHGLWCPLLHGEPQEQLPFLCAPTAVRRAHGRHAGPPGSVRAGVHAGEGASRPGRRPVGCWVPPDLLRAGLGGGAAPGGRRGQLSAAWTLRRLTDAWPVLATAAGAFARRLGAVQVAASLYCCSTASGGGGCIAPRCASW